MFMFMWFSVFQFFKHALHSHYSFLPFSLGYFLHLIDTLANTPNLLEAVFFTKNHLTILFLRLVVSFCPFALMFILFFSLCTNHIKSFLWIQREHFTPLFFFLEVYNASFILGTFLHFSIIYPLYYFRLQCQICHDFLLVSLDRQIRVLSFV